MVQGLLQIFGWIFVVAGIIVIGFEVNVIISSLASIYEDGIFNMSGKLELRGFYTALDALWTFGYGLIMVGIAKILRMSPWA